MSAVVGSPQIEKFEQVSRHAHQMSVLCVCWWGVSGVGGPQVTKFEQISSLGHQMSLAGGQCAGQDWAVGMEGGPCTVRTYIYREIRASWVPVW